MVLKVLTTAAAATLVMMSGCATAPDAPLVANAAGDASTTAAVTSKQKVKVYDKTGAGDNNLHCTRFQPTGSHRIITRCVSQEQRQLEEDAARNTLMKATGPVLQAPADL